MRHHGKEIAPTLKPMSIVDQIMAYESGEMDDEHMVPFFQRLVDSGLAWTLQGSYGRTAQALIDAGEIRRTR